MTGPTINPASIGAAAAVVTSLGSVGGVAGGTSAATGALSSIGKFFKTLSGTKLPLKNPLSAYATYDYVIGLGALSTAEVNDPDSSYIAGKTPLLICKSANASPTNRIKTPLGQFDFYINNLKLSSYIGFDTHNNPGGTVITFDIIEPYSMGMFFIACQTAAIRKGHDSWQFSPFILTIEFRGNKETGAMSNIPGTRRYIPFCFGDISMTADANGSKYTCKAISWGLDATTDAVANFKTDITAEGKTVQEVLQTGVNSLQAGMNRKLRAIAKQQKIETPDEVLILFPNSLTSGENAKDDILARGTSGTTIDPSIDVNSVEATYATLGVSRSEINSSLVQSVGTVNAIGASAIKVGKPDAPQTPDSVVYNKEIDHFMRSLNTADSEKTAVTFPQDTSVLDAITTILLKSAYAEEALQVGAEKSTGMKYWFNCVTQTYIISSKTNTTTGYQPKLHVYKITPYLTHSSKLLAAGGKPSGYDELNKEAVKEYNYMYTGKNVDILEWKLKFDYSFTAELPVSSSSHSTDTERSVKDGSAPEKQAEVKPEGESQDPDKGLGVLNPTVRFIKTLLDYDLKGGGGNDTKATRAAKVWHDAVTRGLEMQALNMKIMGDPYYIVQSGLGNYHSAPSQFSNLNSDGTVNWASGEVDIRVNYRSPIDLNQGTGLYNFGKKTYKDPETAKSLNIVNFSGLYQLIHVDSYFKNGEFTQELKAFRRPMQESTRAPTRSFGISEQAPPAQTTTSVNAADNGGTAVASNDLDVDPWGDIE